VNSDRDRLGGLALGEQLGFDVAPEVVAFDVLRLGSGVVSRGSRLEHERGGDLPRDRVADGGDEDGVIRAGTTQRDAETAPRTEQLEEAFAHELEHRLLLIVAEAFHVLIVED